MSDRRPDVELESPARRIPTDPPVEELRDGLALCLSGGGYRAMLFHLGAVWRLNEAGYLPRLDRVSSVSGGSITAGVLAAGWSRLEFDRRGVAQAFEAEAIEPIRRLASKTIDVPSVIRGLVGPGTGARQLARRYRRHLFGATTLQELPERPRFIFNATNVQSGVLWRFSRPHAWDYRVGRVDRPESELAIAVAASSAFPPFLSPLVLRFNDSDFAAGTGLDLAEPRYRERLYLSDGGVYDNLGLEPAWKRYRTVLISDAGGRIDAEARPSRIWPLHTYRTMMLIDNQVRTLRKRQAISSYATGARDGAYWGIRSDIAHYPTDAKLPAPAEATRELADLPTRLRRLEAGTQKRLINWGYAICDAALRAHVDQGLSAPSGLAYPEAAIT